MSARRNDDKAQKLYNLYMQGKTLREIGEIYNLSNQTIHSMFTRRKWPLRTKKRLPEIQFNSKRYTEKPSGYWTSTDGERTLLHRDVWNFHNGPIPDGYQIHHIDGERGHNTIENLMLVERADHARRHNQARMYLHICPHCGGSLFPDE